MWTHHLPSREKSSPARRTRVGNDPGLTHSDPGQTHSQIKAVKSVRPLIDRQMAVPANGPRATVRAHCGASYHRT